MALLARLHRRHLVAFVLSLATSIASACVAPTTHASKLSPGVLRAEQLKQQQLVIQSEISEQSRLENIAFPMLRSAVPFCGQWVTTRMGVGVANVSAYNKDYREAARALGLTDTLSVVRVTAGSAAERAGVKIGDRVTAISGKPTSTGVTAATDFTERVRPPSNSRSQATLASEPVRLTVRRSAEQNVASFVDVPIAVAADTVCAYRVTALKDETLNAWADGQQVFVTTAMMRFAGTDDELSVVASHEIAHNVMRHMDAKKKNSIAGGIFGAILDVAAATQGINTAGGFTKQGAEAGAMTYSQDFEREADYVGLYILARSGKPFATAPNFWRRMAQESPGSIKYASTHPTSAERFIRLESTVAEIQRKQAENLPLNPDVKSPPKPQ